MTTLCYTYAGFCLVSCPDPTSKEGKGSGDSWALSWLCKVSRYVTCGECYVIHNDLYSHAESMLLWNNHRKQRATIWLACTKTRLLTPQNQEIVQLSPDPFPPLEVGSGHKTICTATYFKPVWNWFQETCTFQPSMLCCQSPILPIFSILRFCSLMSIATSLMACWAATTWR